MFDLPTLIEVVPAQPTLQGQDLPLTVDSVPLEEDQY
jgi:hypothetical protein